MDKTLALLKDKNVSLGLCLVLAVYVAFMSGRFPKVSDFLKSNMGKLIMCGLIVFVSQHNVQLALMLFLVFVTQVNEGFMTLTDLMNKLETGNQDIDDQTDKEVAAAEAKRKAEEAAAAAAG